YSGPFESRLTQELNDFCTWATPTAKEIAVREHVIQRVTHLVSSAVGGGYGGTGRGSGGKYTCVRFGSYATGLYLPDGDVDLTFVAEDSSSVGAGGSASTRTGTSIAVPSNKANQRGNHKGKKRNVPRNHSAELLDTLKQIRNALFRNPLYTNVFFIAFARVPIIKFSDTLVGVHYDISVGAGGGEESVKMVKAFVEEVPMFKELVLVVKQILAAEGLNDAGKAGLGGFATSLIVRAFLKSHRELFPHRYTSSSTTTTTQTTPLGPLLLDFLHYFTFYFDHKTMMIRPTFSTASEIFVPKAGIFWSDSKYHPQIVIQNPLEPERNVAAATGAQK
ncbi:hypothetical protein HK102_012466, partial [Quaeritorhiza haematococci]